MKLQRNFHWIIYSLFVLACARQTTPTGGPKDSIPPSLVSSFPRHGETNFKGQSMELTFSEAVILNNPKEQLIITPDLGKEVDIKANKNKVTITLDENLKDSTTYSLNFREAIQDITEKNPAEMLRLAFSTGNYIDSLFIEGTIYDLLKAKEVKDATVALYQSDTFDIFKHRPTYLTKTDKTGKFKLDNLKPGTYNIYCLEDKNKNLIADSKTESYGYLTNPIELSKNISKITLSLIRLDSRPLKLTSARPYGTYFNIKTTKSLIDYQILTDEDETIKSSFGEDMANIRIYNTFNDKDSVAIQFSANDSIKNSIDTTLYVKFSKRDVKPENFDFTLDEFQVIGTKGILRGKISFSKPVVALNFDSIFYSIDSMRRVSITAQDIRWDSLHNQLTLERVIDRNLLALEPLQGAKPEKILKTNPNGKSRSNEYQLYLGKSAFISVELDSSRRTQEKLPPSKLADTGVIIIQIETKEEHYIAELLTKDFRTVVSKKDAKKITFEDLKPGEYQIRLIIDKNNDGKWSPGNFYQKEEPEPIVFYKNEKEVPIVNLKANWELGPLLINY